VSIAYQVIGEGPVDLVLFPGWFSHMDLQWASPLMTKFLERMASFSRLIMFDKRGVGLSDPVASAPTLDERMDDLRVVMDAAESEQAVIFGLSEGGTMSALFAAAYPERVRALVLYAAWAAGPLVMAEHRLPGWEKTLKSVSILDDAVEHWGDGGIVSMMAPTIAESPAALEFTGAFERAALSRRMASDLWEAIKHHDARAALPLIQAPTLVLHRRDEVVPVEQSRYMAQHIAGAKLIELDGVDHFPWVGDTEAVTKPVEQFIAQLGPPTPRRESVLATVLLLDAPDLHEQRDLIRRELVRHQGREQRFSRAGLLATFGGPARAVTCAAAIRDRLDAHGVLVRAGLHTGECEIAANGMRGIAVEIGAQVASLAAPGEVLVSRTVRDLLYGADIEFAERGVSTLSGPSTPWELYSIARAG
jgi:pimeloyl-ACP methyl ester carboxylesterase